MAGSEPNLRSQPLFGLQTMRDQSKPADRRAFLATASAGLASAALGPSFLPRRLGRGFSDADVRVDVLTKEPIGAVASHHYGHFIEHLGGVVYDGVWVGEKSSIPNYQGIRKALVDDLKALTPGVVRWPGGCFADSY